MGILLCNFLVHTAASSPRANNMFPHSLEKSSYSQNPADALVEPNQKFLQNDFEKTCNNQIFVLSLQIIRKQI